MSGVGSESGDVSGVADESGVVDADESGVSGHVDADVSEDAANEDVDDEDGDSKNEHVADEEPDDDLTLPERTGRAGGGVLWLVATPIGNLDDLTLRALRVLREADVVLAEDTRHTKKLLAHHGVGTPLRSLHAHTSDAKIAALVEALQAGATFALVSDAGTPVVSDPGLRLSAAARDAGVKVTVAPGASA
ncbi:MAG: SAM-dependent methyltransferase, partial [Polyangiales bacterium]